MPFATASESLTSQVIDELKTSFTMELESVANFLAASVNPDGVLAEEVKEALATEVDEELGHARQLARRIKQLGGAAPSAGGLEFGASRLTAGETQDIAAVVRGVIDDENAAIEQYRKIIEITDGTDHVTQDLCIKLLADEEEHRTKFEEFAVEFDGK